MNTTQPNSKITAFPEELITKQELAKRLKICARMVELQTNKEIIPIIRIGSAVRYSWPAVLAALEASQKAPEVVHVVQAGSNHNAA